MYQFLGGLGRGLGMQMVSPFPYTFSEIALTHRVVAYYRGTESTPARAKLHWNGTISLFTNL
jgi:hypothetical protein